MEVNNLYTVFFKNSTGHKRKIATVDTYEEALATINNFLKERNYTSYLKRAWKIDEETTKVDVGSHTAFFYIKEVNKQNSQK